MMKYEKNYQPFGNIECMIIEKHYQLVINEIVDEDMGEKPMSPVVIIGSGYSVDVNKMVRHLSMNPLD